MEPPVGDACTDVLLHAGARLGLYRSESNGPLCSRRSTVRGLLASAPSTRNFFGLATAIKSEPAQDGLEATQCEDDQDKPPEIPDEHQDS